MKRTTVIACDVVLVRLADASQWAIFSSESRSDEPFNNYSAIAADYWMPDPRAKMEQPEVWLGRIVMFLAGDDDAAKGTVSKLGQDLGFELVDVAG